MQEEKLVSKKNQYTITSDHYKELRSKLAALPSEDALRSNLQTHRKKLSDLKEQRQQTLSRGRVLSEILNLKESGALNGIHGRLGDLGVIDEKYDVAITTACGALNNIVVETVAVGEKCLNHLKQYNLGRATFLCLDKLRSYNTEAIQVPPHSARLFDLVTPKDKKFEKAFYHVLQDTLVVENIEIARKIAYGPKRYRVVTLDGSLIDVSGTLSGGGNRPQRGGMSNSFVSSESVSPTAISNMEAETARLERVLNEAISLRKELEKEIASVENRVPAAESEISRLMMDIDASKRQIELLKNEARTINDAERRRLEDLKNQINVYNVEMKKLRESSSKIEAKIATLKDTILQAGGVKLRSQKALVDGISKEIDLCNERLINLTVEKSTREKNIKKVTTGLAGKEKDLNESNQMLQTVAESLNEASDEGRRIHKELDELKEELAELEALMANSKKRLEDAQEALDSFRSQEVASIAAKLQECRGRLKEVEAESLQYSKALSKLQLQSSGFEDDFDPELRKFSNEELLEFDSAILEKDIKEGQEKLSKLSPNLSVLTEYKQKLQLYEKRSGEVNEVTERRDAARALVDDLRKRRLEEFMDGFTLISTKLKEMYQMITLGGNAELELVDTMDPFSEGIVFSVMPPKKSWKNIANLSGGEKPTPIYFMDEIDAALDFRNVSIVANYIKERTRDAQFIIISLRNNMFELADRLVGIYKLSKTWDRVMQNLSWDGDNSRDLEPFENGFSKNSSTATATKPVLNWKGSLEMPSIQSIHASVVDATISLLKSPHIQIQYEASSDEIAEKMIQLQAISGLLNVIANVAHPDSQRYAANTLLKFIKHVQFKPDTFFRELTWEQVRYLRKNTVKINDPGEELDEASDEESESGSSDEDGIDDPDVTDSLAKVQSSKEEEEVKDKTKQEIMSEYEKMADPNEKELIKDLYKPYSHTSANTTFSLESFRASNAKKKLKEKKDFQVQFDETLLSRIETVRGDQSLFTRDRIVPAVNGINDKGQKEKGEGK
ncbi:hypothetical protein HDU96_004491 [Phlyctochytrium bullatum]|nr:hypothetical protein HDU96_004491 [Phlyctochytrium bullatum]